MDDLAKDVRTFIYACIRETSAPPALEAIMRRFELSRGEAREVLKTVEESRHVVLLRNTDRILMAHPFSAVATPFRVTPSDGQVLFANCAYDAVAMHLTLGVGVRIDSFCHHSGEEIAIELSAESVRSMRPEGTIVYLGLPAARWWDDIVHTCSNTMVFFASEDRLDEWLATNGIDSPGQSLNIEKTIELGRAAYVGRMERDYERPSPAQLRRHFESLGLTGPFWAL